MACVGERSVCAAAHARASPVPLIRPDSRQVLYCCVNDNAVMRTAHALVPPRPCIPFQDPRKPHPRFPSLRARRWRPSTTRRWTRATRCATAWARSRSMSRSRRPTAPCSARPRPPAPQPQACRAPPHSAACRTAGRRPAPPPSRAALIVSVPQQCAVARTPKHGAPLQGAAGARYGAGLARAGVAAAPPR